MSTSQATLQPTGHSTWSERARYFNSGNAFALKHPAVPSVQFIKERDRAFDPDSPTGLIDMDLSAELQTPFPATTPFVLSRYARIRAGESLTVQVRASAQLFSILTGQGTTTIDGERVQWKAGDILALPGAAKVLHEADNDAVAWLVTDEPTLAFLDVEPVSAGQSAVPPVQYLADDLDEELNRLYADPESADYPGYAIVLSHQSLEHTRNIHPTMTLALNSLPPASAQRPHVHNSMALTLCTQGEGCYSLIDGERKDWSQHAVMVTPPCAVHSHHNDGNERMQCLIVQDGGLYYHGRTMGFAYAD